MTIPTTSVRKALDTEALREIIRDIEYELNHTWAVYADYRYEDMTWQVNKIERWNNAQHSESMHHIRKVTDAKDELDAYRKFMEQTDGKNN